MDSELEKWRTRKLGKYPYLIVDAIYEKVRHDGHVVSLAVLVAYGINEKGMREVLGLSVSLSEAEVHWRTFFESLIARGLHGVELITSDAHTGGYRQQGKRCFQRFPGNDVSFIYSKMHHRM